MISYLGVTFDELIQTFENSFAFSDDRPDRLLEEPVSFVDDDEEADEDLASEDDMELDFDVDDDEDDVDDFMEIDENGQLHAFGETVSEAADAAAAFLTDYIVADQIEDSWLPLHEARGALLALQTLLPELDEVTDVDCAYHFEIKIDATTAEPSFITMRPLTIATAPAESLTRTDSGYEGVVTDNTALTELFIRSEVPEADQQLLTEVISEAVIALAEQQCGVVFDVRAFCSSIARLAAAHQTDELHS